MNELLGPVVDDSRYCIPSHGPRPAGPDNQCFYCGVEVGNQHCDDCVLFVRQVRVRLTVEYAIEVPAKWDEEMILFHRNEGTWCATNALYELEDRFGDEGDACMCGAATFEVVPWSES